MHHWYLKRRGWPWVCTQWFVWCRHWLRACFGGLACDLICRQTPLVLHEELYASVALVASVIPRFAELGIKWRNSNDCYARRAFTACMAAVRFKWRLPSFQLRSGKLCTLDILNDGEYKRVASHEATLFLLCQTKFQFCRWIKRSRTRFLRCFCCCQFKVFDHDDVASDQAIQSLTRFCDRHCTNTNTWIVTTFRD